VTSALYSRASRRGRSAPSAVADDGRARLTLVSDPLRVLLSLLTIVTISRVHLHYPILAAFRPVLLLSVMGIGYAFLQPSSLTRENVLNLWPMRVVTAFGVLACISAPFGISLGNSGSFILDSYAKTVAYAFLIAMSVRNARDLYTYVWAFVISCGILSFFAVFVFGLESAGGSSLNARLGELYTYDSNDLGVLLMMGLPLTFMLLFVDRGMKRLLLFVNLVGISVAMARSGSRGGFLGLVAVALATLFFANGVSVFRRTMLLGGGAIALALAAPPGYWDQMATILKPKADYNYSSTDGRNALMKRGFGYMRKYPVFGIGIWNFAKAECTISPKIQSRDGNEAIRCTAPHNSVVQAGAELGVPGLILWAALCIGLVVAPLRLRRRLPSSWRKGAPGERFLYAATCFFPVAAAGFIVTSFFVTFAFADPVYLMAALVAGLYIAVAAQIGASQLLHRPAMRNQESTATGLPGWRVRKSARRTAPASPAWSAAN
jgi:O-antigen ligase